MGFVIILHTFHDLELSFEHLAVYPWPFLWSYLLFQVNIATHCTPLLLRRKSETRNLVLWLRKFPALFHSSISPPGSLPDLTVVAQPRNSKGRKVSATCSFWQSLNLGEYALPYPKKPCLREVKVTFLSNH